MNVQSYTKSVTMHKIAWDRAEEIARDRNIPVDTAIEFALCSAGEVEHARAMKEKEDTIRRLMGELRKVNCGM